jgi:hypothetical protein
LAQKNRLVAVILAERVGFEPTVRLPVRLISSQVHSTTLPPLRVTKIISLPQMRKITGFANAVREFGLVKTAYPEYPPTQIPFNAGGFGAFSSAHLKNG